VTCFCAPCRSLKLPPFPRPLYLSRLQGPHTGTNTDSVTFDMDRPTYEDERAIDDYYSFSYNPNTDDKPFSSGLLE
jgi:hypothetical protein